MNDRRRSESFLERLVAVPSVSGDEAAIVTVCRDLMAEVGLATRFRPCAGVEGAVNVEGLLGSADGLKLFQAMVASGVAAR